MSIIRKEQLSNPLSASYAATASIATSASFATTASFALNVGTSINTGSFVTTSSFNAFTASINSFTSSINAFTASYSTGSFTGSFTGSLLGTSSWAVSASQALSSSFYQETDPIFTARSSSLATTGSNIFRGNQVISGSGINTILQVHGANAEPWAFGIYNDTYNPTQSVLAGFVDNTGEASIGTEVNKPLYIYTNANYASPTLTISSSGVTVGTGGITGSLFGTASWAINALTASHINSPLNQNLTIVGNQTITGSLTITNNLSVLGTTSIQYISESTLNIGTNLITVNTNTPSVRFGGLAVIDSGSSPITSASFLYDALQDEFIFVHRGDGTNITSSHFILGPETYNDLGNETYLTVNRIPKGKGNEHLNDSNISDNGTLVNINSNTNITGSLLISGSSLIVSSSQFEMPNNIIVNSTTRRLNSGSALSVDWGNRTLHASNNATTIEWQNRYLNAISARSIDWGNWQLIDFTGTQASVDWNSRLLNTSNNILALDWSGDYVNFSNTYLYRFYDKDAQNNFALSVQHSGEVINAAVSSSAIQYQLVALSGSYWSPVDQTTDTSTKMLGIAIVPQDDPNKGQVLIKGDITWDGSDGVYIHPGITFNDEGKSVYIRENANSGEMSIIPPTSGYVRIVGYVYYEDSGTYIFRFKPSNDWYKLS